MTNQQLKAHCEDVIANPQDHSEMVLVMAKALLPCLEAKPVFFVEIEGDDWTNSGRIEGDERPDLGLLPEGINHLYSAPPVPELKLPPRMTNPNQLATEGTLWNDCLDVIERLNALHTAPIEPICATGGAEWVKVSDKMPLELSDEHISEVEVIVTDGTTVGTCEYRRGYLPMPWAEWSNYGDIDADKITHWQPMPSVPDA